MEDALALRDFNFKQFGPVAHHLESRPGRVNLRLYRGRWHRGFDTVIMDFLGLGPTSSIDGYLLPNLLGSLQYASSPFRQGRLQLNPRIELLSTRVSG
jgi:hypothetical protein